jgi:hypothetical protein
MESPPIPSKGAPLPYYLKDIEKKATSPVPASTEQQRIAQLPSNNVDMNKDIEVTPQAGQWLIMVMSYAGPKAPEMARNFVAVLRRDYKLNAYVFNYGAEEKRKEYERVQKLRQEQIDALAKAGLKADVPIRISTMKIDEHTGVLVGGYKSFEEAAKALKTIKALNPEGLRGKVDLDVTLITSPVEAGSAKKPARVEVVEKSITFVNPFQRAFPCRNPSLPKEQLPSTSEEEMKLLRHYNREEPYSLLNCKQPYTLTVKQFVVQFKTLDAAKESDQKAKKFLQDFSLGLIRTGKEWEDRTAHSAHNLAKQLRNHNLEAYVLHCRHCSYVTVGGFHDLKKDARLLSMQNELERFFKMPPFNDPDLALYPRPVPMPVPGVWRSEN